MAQGCSPQPSVITICTEKVGSVKEISRLSVLRFTLHRLHRQQPSDLCHEHSKVECSGSQMGG